MAWDFSTEPEFEEKLEWMTTFVKENVYPLELIDMDWRTFRKVCRPLQQQVKDAGLWAPHLGPELGGQGFGQVKLGLMHEILGASDYAPFVFGCQAPDSGNSELLAIAGTEEQKRQWMLPLLDGSMMSAYSMTEQGTGSDPKQFRTTAVRDGNEWVIDGDKWFEGNGSRSDFHILMAVTNPDVHPYQGMSMFIVPTETSGISTRELGMMNHPDKPSPLWSHDEVAYRDVRIPAENILGGEGQAFVLAQKRLGPGRMHHCMRWLGVSKRAFDMMCERAVSKSVHGSLLGEKQMIQQWIADSAASMAAARLLTLQTAWKLDTVGSHEARVDIAMIKYFGATIMHDVIDRAIQIHGSLGFSSDLPLEAMYRWSRAARLYDGPDEVHKVTVARQYLKQYRPHDVPTEHIPTRMDDAQRRFAELLELVSAAE